MSRSWKRIRIAAEKVKPDVRKRLMTRAKIKTVESWSVGKLERKRSKTRAKINAVER